MNHRSAIQEHVSSEVMHKTSMQFVCSQCIQSIRSALFLYGGSCVNTAGWFWLFSYSAIQTSVDHVLFHHASQLNTAPSLAEWFPFCKKWIHAVLTAGT